MNGPVGQTRAINPFLLPPCEDGRSQLLCPWRQPTHDGYYVAIGDSQSTFEKFTSRMTDVATLQQRGHLVLVVGGGGHGKTSLINRCAHWLKNELDAKKARGLLINVTEVAPFGEPQSVVQRMKVVCEQIRDEVEFSDRLLDSEQLNRLEDLTERPDRFYRLLGNALPDSVVLIVVLPPADDLIEEVFAYTKVVGRRMLLLTESSLLTAEAVRRRAAQQPSPIVLELGGLKTGDIRLFVRDRLDRWPDACVYPDVPEEALQWMEDGGLPYTIRSLQSVFAGLYGDLLENEPTYGTGYVVSTQQIVKATMGYLQGNGD